MNLLFLFLGCCVCRLITETTYVEEIVTVSPEDPFPSIYSEIYNYSGPHSINSTFATTALDLTNQKRMLHNATTVSWNSTLYDYAADYASKYNCSGILVHSGGHYGENLAIGYSLTGAIDAWYDEGKSYPYGTEKVYNHFTALIWNSTTEIGCYSKYCNEIWGDYIICSYYPEGNVIGWSENNVFPLV